MIETVDRSARAEDARRRGSTAFLLSPWVQIVVSILLSAAAQIFLRLGVGHRQDEAWAAFHGLFSGWVWAGIIAQIVSLLSWLQALRTIKLLIAFNLSGILHVLVPLAGWLCLGEKIPPMRWLGIILVLAGVFVVASPAARVEEML